MLQCALQYVLQWVLSRHPLAGGALQRIALYCIVLQCAL